MKYGWIFSKRCHILSCLKPLGLKIRKRMVKFWFNGSYILFIFAVNRNIYHNGQSWIKCYMFLCNAQIDWLKVCNIIYLYIMYKSRYWWIGMLELDFYVALKLKKTNSEASPCCYTKYQISTRSNLCVNKCINSKNPWASLAYRQKISDKSLADLTSLKQVQSLLYLLSPLGLPDIIFSTSSSDMLLLHKPDVGHASYFHPEM